MRKRKKHWKKEEAANNETKILKLLEKKDMRFSELQMELSDMSPTTLDTRLKALLTKKLISRYWYEAKKANYYRVDPESKEQVTGALGGYEAVRFIKSIQNPVYSYKVEDRFKVATFSAVPATVNRKQYEGIVKSWISERAVKLLKSFIKIKPNAKMALVIMIDAPEG